MNAHNFTHTGYLLRIKAAVLRAVRKANRPGQPRATATETVYNRRDKPSLLIIARARQGFEVFGGKDQDDDVTPLVLDALGKMHARARAFPGVRLRNVRLSFAGLRPPEPQVDTHTGNLGHGLAWGFALVVPMWAGIAGAVSLALGAWS